MGATKYSEPTSFEEMESQDGVIQSEPVKEEKTVKPVETDETTE